MGNRTEKGAWVLVDEYAKAYETTCKQPAPYARAGTKRDRARAYDACLRVLSAARELAPTLDPMSLGKRVVRAHIRQGRPWTLLGQEARDAVAAALHERAAAAEEEKREKERREPGEGRRELAKKAREAIGELFGPHTLGGAGGSS